MVSRMLRSFGRVTMLVGTVGLTLTASALAKPLPGVRTARPTRGFALFAGTTLNQTGQAIETIAITMGVYLALSLITSALMNWYNARLQERWQ